MGSSKNRTQMIVHSAAAAALGAVLSLIIIYRMPQGGSICLGAFVPVWLIAFRYGPWAGMSCGAALGALNFLQNPIVYHPLQPVVDYLLAWSCLGLAGYFPEHQLSGIVISGFCQLVCYILSGACFFSATLGATDVCSALYPSLIYNVSYGIPNLVVAIVLFQVLRVKSPHLFKE